MKAVDPDSRAVGRPDAAQPGADATPDAAAELSALRARCEDLERENEALRRANEQLARERDGHRQRYDGLTIACATLDPTGTVIDGNPALAALLHLPADAIAGVNLETAIAVPQHVQRFRDHLVAVFRSHVAHGCELWLRRPDGGVTRVRLETCAEPDVSPPRCRSAIFEVSTPAAQAQSGLARERHTPSSPPPVVTASQDGSSTVDAARATSATILVIEDESLVRKAVQHYLSGAGYRVLTAMDGAGALERSQHHDGPIDLILTDLSLPTGGNGPEIAQRIQQHRPQAGVLYMTACPAQLLARRGFAAQVGQTLEKPFTKEALLARVAKSLAQAAAPVQPSSDAEAASPPNDEGG